ncbi:9926_t:CDS:2 [Funneliformis mosseae]|uniref:9926_t:CDS:1 n=1 Tax=Funneliformis mosseae TaxID=27381 RepID=A0A9N9E397_FUNMO|nr:9926_t:CDS:2 [Funneliformis mosseae]
MVYVLTAWLHGNQPSRIKQYPYPTANFWSSILSLLPIFFQHQLCKWLTARILTGAVSAVYFPDHFLQGASLAARQVCAALSIPVDRDDLQLMLTTRFYDRMINELDKLESEKSKVTIDIPKIYGINVRDIWVTLGPRKAYSEKNREYRILKWMTLTLAIRKTQDDNMNESRAKIAKSFSDGINFKVDVEIDAEVTYTLKSAKDEILIDDRSRRPVLFRFESPHFEPTDRIYYKVSSDLIEEPPVNWNWRVGDIDYLLEIEELENEAREEKDLSQLED